MRFPPRHWGRRLVIWLALNTLRLLTVAALIAWVNPHPIRWHITVPVYSPVLHPSIQIAPCPPWAIDMGRWETGYVCGQYPNAEARYKLLLKKG